MAVNLKRWTYFSWQYCQKIKIKIILEIQKMEIFRKPKTSLAKKGYFKKNF